MSSAAELADRLPHTRHNRVWHTGWLDADRRQTWSAEGNLLSVSEHPDAWEHIARLGGAPRWHLTPIDAEGAERDSRFITVTEIGRQHQDDIWRWGEKEGYVEAAQVWTATWYDDEWDDLMVVQATSRAELEAETEGYGGEITVADGWKATDKLAARGRGGRLLAGEEIDPLDHLVILLAEAGGYDGVWWDEILDTSRLSAPRGGIGAWAWTRWAAELAQNPA